MKIITHTIHNTLIAEIENDAILIHTSEDGLNLLGNIYYQGFDRVILYENQITSDFFNLKNGIAGEILQKFSNYRVKLAIVGNFSKYTGRSISEFMYESNKNRQINFVFSLSDALVVLSK